MLKALKSKETMQGTFTLLVNLTTYQYQVQSTINGLGKQFISPQMDVKEATIYFETLTKNFDQQGRAI